MRKRYCSFLVCILLLFATQVQAHQSEKEIAAALDAFLAQNNAPGVVVSLLPKGEKTPLTVARGRAQVENNLPMRKDAVLKFGSVTKVFTALEIKYTIAQGRLRETTDIRPFFPELAKGPEITVQQLLTHTSGLPELLSFPEVLENTAKAWTPHELLTLAASRRLNFTPGTKQQYSNTNYFLLGLLLEQLNPGPAPLTAHTANAMPSLRMCDDSSVVPRAASGYALTKDNKLSLPVMLSASSAFGTGNLAGTAGDLVLLARILPSSGLLTPHMKPVRLADGSPATQKVTYGGMSYNFSLLEGLALFDFGNGRIFVGKDGMFPGFAAQFIYDPATGAAVAVLTNQEQAAFAAFKLAISLLENESAPSATRSPAP